MKLHDLQRRLPRPFLTALARLYSIGVQGRLVLYRTGYLRSNRLNAPTISVGNIAVGGTGKTPLVELLARTLMNKAYKVAILTRGYGRDQPRQRRVVSDGLQVLDDADLAGDEPVMLARHLPGVIVIADRDRFAAGRWAEQALGVDIHLLDDGFQHLELERDVNILLIDALDPFAGEQPLPLGRLREPVSEMVRADAIVVTGSDRPFDQAELEVRVAAVAGEKPFFYAYRTIPAFHQPATGVSFPPQRITDRPIALLSAIARPDRFRDDLNHFRAHIVREYPFPDHHRFSQKEIDSIYAGAKAGHADLMVTTEKDWMRLSRLALPSRPPLWIALSEMRVVEEAKLLNFVLGRIERANRTGSSRSPRDY